VREISLYAGVNAARIYRPAHVVYLQNTPQEIREEFEKITRGRLIEAYGLTETSPAALTQIKRASDEDGFVHLRAHVILHRNMTVTLEELLKYCSKRLHASAVPDSITLERQETASP
jgi:hypothetical protein